ncbi:MAG: regulator [Anabaena sp. CRKS33]|jgi:DNA-binding NarL/FixJ family response regulator|nr:MAG: regulator [Anabaena sp. CRKS33]
MSDRILQLLLIDPDPIFRLGLKVTLETIPNLQVIADVPSDTSALKVIAEILAVNYQQIHLIILALNNEQLGEQFCRQLKTLYPHIPILLLTSTSQRELIISAKAIGINGYCPKGVSISQLVPILEQVANGGYYWFEDGKMSNFTSSSLAGKLRNHLQSSGINYIDDTLYQVTEQLKLPGITLLNKAILAGQRRELLAARWFVSNLLKLPHKRQNLPPNLPPKTPINQVIIKSETQPLIDIPTGVSSQQLQSELLTLCLNKLKFPLENLTDTPLEIDILGEDKKRELLYIILHKFFQQLDEIRNFNFNKNQIFNLKEQILLDLWQFSITDFFSNYSRISLDKQEINLVKFLLDKNTDLQKEIIKKVPLFGDFLSYLLLCTDLYIDNVSCPFGSKEAQSQALLILENLLIHIANNVIQPLLNYLADVETIKQNFYHRQMISTREIERFRNNLSWKYRLNQYINEAQTIFESRYELFVFAPRGIAKISIYAPRTQELAELSGIPLGVTLMLEFRDAIAPRLQSLLGFLGTGIVFVLTQVIGRGLGLVGRGILQGIGSVSLTEKGQRKNKNRE